MGKVVSKGGGRSLAWFATADDWRGLFSCAVLMGTSSKASLRWWDACRGESMYGLESVAKSIGGCSRRIGVTTSLCFRMSPIRDAKMT